MAKRNGFASKNITLASKRNTLASRQSGTLIWQASLCNPYRIHGIIWINIMQQFKNELTQNIPPALSQFDQLPNSAYIRLPVIMSLYGVSAATIWRGVKNSTVPKPAKLSERCTAWNVGLVRKALAEKSVQL